MTREDPWGDAVNNRPEPNPMPAADDKGNKQDDPVWNKAGAVVMAVCTIAIVLTMCALVLRACGVF
jgi:hypothetical protein